MRVTEEHERRPAANTSEHDVVVQALGRSAAPKPLERGHDETSDSCFHTCLEGIGLVPVSHRNATNLETARRDTFAAEQAPERRHRVRVVVPDDHAPFASSDGPKEGYETIRGFELRAFRRADSDGFSQVAEHEDPVPGQCLDERKEILGGVARPLVRSWNEVGVGKTERGRKRLVEIVRDREARFGSEAPSGRFDVFQVGDEASTPCFSG